MITYLPNIYPDELLYSYFCRYNIHSGNITHKMSFNDLYTKRSDVPSQEFVGNLNTDIINILDKIYGIKANIFSELVLLRCDTRCLAWDVSTGTVLFDNFSERRQVGCHRCCYGEPSLLTPH